MRRLGKRRAISAAYQVYCGKKLEGAHDAKADAEAALEVLLAQVERYHKRPDRPDLPADAQGLHDFCQASDPKNVDSKGKFAWRFGSASFNFGKHQTRTLEDVARIDRSYLEFLARGDNPELAEICRKALAGDFPKKPA